ncbi:MAG: class I SAM-dependent methyltransferase [Gammaproteobacteria bacterium]|jgi:SAM-dependent methyltransferase|nr:class I SAM-dependent methyltransferase [Gammaproteobacteria bacterium]MBT6042434.1 class I SAM-dependent methyltransferase [Gammaproteobacteria bacterium]
MADKLPQEMESDSWAGDMGEKWNTYADQFEGMIAPVGKAAIEYAGFQAGERVIDIGCGAGATTFQIAGQVGDGHVTGLDLSQTLVDTANQRLSKSGHSNVDFICADAASSSQAEYDVLFSRFGVMFFEDPYGAFQNMRTFLKEKGRISFVCWGPPAEQPWVGQLMAIAAKYVELPPPVPNAPGPFAFGNQDYLRDILVKAGFKDIEIARWQGSQNLGGSQATAESAARFVMDALFLGDALAEEAEEIKAQAYQEAVELLQGFVVGNKVELQGCAWLVRANC